MAPANSTLHTVSSHNSCYLYPVAWANYNLRCAARASHFPWIIDPMVAIWENISWGFLYLVSLPLFCSLLCSLLLSDTTHNSITRHSSCIDVLHTDNCMPKSSNTFKSSRWMLCCMVTDWLSSAAANREGLVRALQGLISSNNTSSSFKSQRTTRILPLLQRDSGRITSCDSTIPNRIKAYEWELPCIAILDHFPVAISWSGIVLVLPGQGKGQAAFKITKTKIERERKKGGK